MSHSFGELVLAILLIKAHFILGRHSKLQRIRLEEIAHPRNAQSDRLHPKSGYHVSPAKSYTLAPVQDFALNLPLRDQIYYRVQLSAHQLKPNVEIGRASGGGGG